MKKLLILAIIILSVFLIYFFFNTNQKVYSAVGDFYAAGLNSDNSYEYGYPDYIKDIYKENNVLKYYDNNYTKDSYSIEKMRLDIKNNDFKVEKGTTISVKKVLREADILTITIGMNDLLEYLNLRKIDDLEYLNKLDIDKGLIDIEQDLNKLILEIRKYAKRDIILVGYYFPNKKNYPNIYYVSKQFDNIYNKISKKYKIEYISSNYLLKNQKSNEIYPSYKMYKFLATSISKVLQKNK